jgi:hypothetical protein
MSYIIFFNKCIDNVWKIIFNNLIVKKTKIPGGFMRRVMMLVGIVCVVFIAGCGNNDSPSSAARKFYAAVEKNDAKAMGQVATVETVQLMAMFGEKAAGMVAANGKIKSTTEKIDGDTAVVILTFENGETENLDLKKIDGKWKVAISK